MISICLLLNALPSGLSSSPAAEDYKWGMPVNGLQMSLSAIGSLKGNDQEFQLALRNAGDNDIIVNLGSMLANGKVQLPDNIILSSTDAEGKTRKCRFGDKRHLFVAGRVDDYLIPLRAGSIYTLRLNMDQFWCPSLPQGRNQLTAEFEGGGAKIVNLDMAGIKLMNFWIGKVQSNTLAIER